MTEQLAFVATTAPINERLTITVPEAGRLLGLSRSSAYEAARRSEIPTVRIGRRLLVPVPALLQMLGAGQSATASLTRPDDRRPAAASPPWRTQ